MKKDYLHAMPLMPRSLLDSFLPLYIQETELSMTTRYSAAPSFQRALKPYEIHFQLLGLLGLIPPNLELLSKPCVFQL
jgi:hypothetical protein